MSRNGEEQQRPKEKRAILRRRRQEAAPLERAWVQGVRTQGDVIAPSGLRFAGDGSYGQIGRLYYTVLHISSLDPETGVGFLQRLVQGSEPVDVAWWVKPFPREQAMTHLTSGAATALAEMSAMQEKGLVDPMAVRGAQDMEALRHLVDAGEEVIWTIGFYVLVRADSLPALDKAVRNVYTLLGHGAHARIAYELMWPGLEAFTPAGQQLAGGGLSHVLDTTTLVKSWPLGSASLRRPNGIFWGYDRDNSGMVIFDPFDRTMLRNSNMVICGPSGAGKSFFVKLLLLRLLQQGVRFVVIDPKPDEYSWVCEAIGPDVADFIPLSASARRGLPLFDLQRRAVEIEGETFLPVRRKVASLRGQLAEMLGGLTPEQEGVLDAALFTVYQQIAGLVPDVTSVPADVRLPRLIDLVRVLEQGGEGVSEALSRALKKYAQGGSLAGLYDADQFVQVGDKRLVAFGIAGLSKEDRPAASLMVSDWVTSAIFSSGGTIPYILNVDEAWTLLAGPGAVILSDLVRVARSLNAGVWCISQLVEDFVGTKDRPKDQGQVIFENSAIHVYLPGAVGNPQALPASVGMGVDQITFLRQAQVGECLLDVSGRWLRLQTGRGAHTPTEYKVCTSRPQEVAIYRKEIRQ